MNKLFSPQSMKDELFCVTEERNYFEAKYLEQISQISSLQSELDQKKSEIQRLRQQLLQQFTNTKTCDSGSNRRSSASDEHHHMDEKKEDDDDVSVLDDDDSVDSDSDDDDDSGSTSTQQDIRQNAAQLLQWASYQESRSSMSPQIKSSPISSSNRPMVRTTSNINVDTAENDDDDEQADSTPSTPRAPPLSPLHNQDGDSASGRTDADEEAEPSPTKRRPIDDDEVSSLTHNLEDLAGLEDDDDPSVQ